MSVELRSLETLVEAYKPQQCRTRGLREQTLRGSGASTNRPSDPSLITRPTGCSPSSRPSDYAHPTSPDSPSTRAFTDATPHSPELGIDPAMRSSA